MTAGKRVLVYGGSGALGDALVNFLKSKSYWIVSVDLKGLFLLTLIINHKQANKELQIKSEHKC